MAGLRCTSEEASQHSQCQGSTKFSLTTLYHVLPSLCAMVSLLHSCRLSGSWLSFSCQDGSVEPPFPLV